MSRGLTVESVVAAEAKPIAGRRPAAALRHRDIPADKRAVIRTLHRLNPWWNLQALALLGAWALGARAAFATELLGVRLLCYALSGAALQGLGIMMHEGVHHLMFRNPRLNRWVGFACGLPALLSVTAYRVGHLPHHRHERGARDPDELENVSRDPRVLALLFCLTAVLGQFFGFYRVGPWNALRTTAQERRDILVEYGIIAGVFAVAFAVFPIEILLHAWIIPAVVATQVTNVRTLAEHVLTPAGNRLNATRTVLSNRLVSLFMCNLNYHTVHHLYPGVPFYRLPRLHGLLREELERAGAQVYRSYTRFLLDLATFVVKAWGPRGRLLPLVLPAGRPSCARS